MKPKVMGQKNIHLSFFIFTTMKKFIHSTFRFLTFRFNYILNLLPRFTTFNINLSGELYYDYSVSYHPYFILYSPIFVMFPIRNNNLFVKNLCLQQQEDIPDYMNYHCCSFEGDIDDWLRHTKAVISNFLNKAEKVSPHPMNFWMSKTIVQHYQANTYLALAWIDDMQQRASR